MFDINGPFFGGMPRPQIGAFHYHAQLRLPDKGRVCYVVYIGSMIYGMDVWTRARCVCLVRCCGQDGYRAQVRNTLFIHTDTDTTFHINKDNYVHKIYS